MLSLYQKLSMQQKLSPQQIQYQKLLQLNTMALEQRIKTELELNPILEETLDEEIELTQDQLEDSDDKFEESESEEEVYEEYRRYCEQKGIILSKQFENFMIEELKKNKSRS